MLILVRPSVEVNAVECDALRADRNHCDVRTHVAIEAVLVHAQVLRRIAQANETRVTKALDVETIPMDTLALRLDFSLRLRTKQIDRLAGPAKP